MRSGNQKRGCDFAPLGQIVGKMPTWEKIVGTSAAALAAVIVTSSLGGAQIGIMVYHAMILTVLAWLTYRYARSTDAMARAIVNLGKTSQRETLLSMAQKVSQERAILNEILEELRKAEKSPRPPFELSAWDRNSHKLESIKEWTEVDVDAIASCYRHLTKQNMEVGFWEEIQERLEGLVNAEKRRNLDTTLKALEHQNLDVIKPVISMLVSHLRQ
jgi:hypothetical protein